MTSEADQLMALLTGGPTSPTTAPFPGNAAASSSSSSQSQSQLDPVGSRDANGSSRAAPIATPALISRPVNFSSAFNSIPTSSSTGTSTRPKRSSAVAATRNITQQYLDRPTTRSESPVDFSFLNDHDHDSHATAQAGPGPQSLANRSATFHHPDPFDLPIPPTSNMFPALSTTGLGSVPPGLPTPPPVPLKSSTRIEDVPPVVKRKRGRPRTKPEPDPNVPKRKRGRPRKHPVSAEPPVTTGPEPTVSPRPLPPPSGYQAQANGVGESRSERNQVEEQEAQEPEPDDVEEEDEDEEEEEDRKATPTGLPSIGDGDKQVRSKTKKKRLRKKHLIDPPIVPTLFRLNPDQRDEVHHLSSHEEHDRLERDDDLDHQEGDSHGDVRPDLAVHEPPRDRDRERRLLQELREQQRLQGLQQVSLEQQREIERALNPAFATNLLQVLELDQQYYDCGLKAVHEELLAAQIEESLLEHVKEIALNMRDNIRNPLKTLQEIELVEPTSRST
ncbi:uncharacterized protein JCM15063_005424 [Sporobolomyces koalae]|uniref:uncharacterized protein n=1 Tax=Sporobolomyces koalae TaxID=500713 RepID=UPI00316F24CA